MLTEMRMLVYLRRIAEALERIAEFADQQTFQAPNRRSRKTDKPAGEVTTATVTDFNKAWRERLGDLAPPPSEDI